MRIFKTGNKNKKSLAYTYVTSTSDSGIWGGVQKKVAKFAHHTRDLVWESLDQRRKVARMCATFKAYTGERVRKAIGDRLQAPSYLSRADHYRKIRARRQRTDTGK